MAQDSTEQLQGWLERMKQGDLAARDELLRLADRRLRNLAAKMTQDFPRLRAWEETDDVLQNASVRLLCALEVSPIGSVQDFFRLAATQIRRELLDLSRHYYGPHGPARHIDKPAGGLAESGENATQDEVAAPSSCDPQRLTSWTLFHERIEALPAEQRPLFDLIWYHGLTQGEAALVLDLSAAKVRRLWLAARLRLRDCMRDQTPN